MLLIVGCNSMEAKLKKQTLVTKSPTEMVALSDMSSLAIWWSEFLLYQGYSISATEIEQYNASCMLIPEKGKSFYPFLKHINIRYFFVKDNIEKGEIN